MQITLEDGGDSCTLHQTTCSGKAHMKLPINANALKSGIVAFVKDVDARDTMVETLMLTKNQSEVKVHYGNGSFGIPFVNLFALILDDE